MNKEKKLQITKNSAKQILVELKNKKYFDGFITKYYKNSQCMNYLSKQIESYFKEYSTLSIYNKNTWINIFDDQDLINSIVYYMQDFNLYKELEEENNH